MQTIDSLDLVLVTGGSTPTNTIDKGGGGGSTNNDALLDTLTGISSSLKDLSKNQNQGLFSGTNGLLFVMLALSQQRNTSTVVYAGGPGYGGPRHGFRFRVW